MDQENQNSNATVETVQSGGPYKVVLPPNREICSEVESLLGNKKISIENLTEAIAKDPIIVMELLRLSNSVNLAPGKTQVTSISNALVALGLDTLSEVLDQLLERPSIATTELSECLEQQRSQCVETARVSRIIARIAAPSLANTAYTSGVLFFIGDMIAVCHLRGKYVELAKSQIKRSKINYRLLQDFDFDVDDVGINYLQKMGIPEKLYSCLDRTAVPMSDESANVRTMCFSAVEMMDAFEAGRWERYAPGQKIPSASSIRMLQLSDQKYAQVYEKLSAYFAGEAAEIEAFTEEEIKSAAESPPPGANKSDKGAIAPMQASLPNPESPQQAARADNATANLTAESVATDPQPSPAQEAASTVVQAPATAGLGRLDSMFGETLNWLKKAKDSKVEQKKKEEQSVLTVPDAPQSIASKTKQALSGFESLISAAENTEDLLSQLLSQLVTCGSFEKSALLVVADDRRSAKIHMAAGGKLKKGETIIIDDPFSPLARACSKVQSIGVKDSDISPFGTKSFALAPIDSSHDLPVILYADRGNEAINLAGRRLFRNVVAALNERLAKLPGGLPE